MGWGKGGEYLPSNGAQGGTKLLGGDRSKPAMVKFHGGRGEERGGTSCKGKERLVYLNSITLKKLKICENDDGSGKGFREGSKEKRNGGRSDNLFD